MPAPYSLPSGTAWPGPLWVVVLAGGRGTRMKSPLAKVLHPLAGLPIGAHVKKIGRIIITAWRAGGGGRPWWATMLIG